ncbi:MAG: glutathione S-transferase N-terminal domain-containing protein, partial [Myxococcota bacterium]
MKVDVYGADHSPWVQAVLLGLHEKGIPYSLRSLPPLAAFRKWGVLMPAVSIDGGAWEVESSEILVKLGFDPIPKEDMRAVRYAWQGVLHRADNPLRFFSAFSRVAHGATSGVRRSLVSFFWSFTAVYMITLINIAKLTGQQKDPKDFGEQYLYWERALEVSKGEFMDGHTPGARDLLLFGIVQCHSSSPVPP